MLFFFDLFVECGLSILYVACGALVAMNFYFFEVLLNFFFINNLVFSLNSFSLKDPLEQFEILLVFKQLGLTNLSTVLFFISLLSFILLALLTGSAVSNVYSYCTSLMYTLVKTIAKENLHLKRHQYFLMLFYLFITIFLSNLIGLVPYSFTPTSSFIMTFFLALGHFMGINFIAATRTG